MLLGFGQCCTMRHSAQTHTHICLTLPFLSAECLYGKLSSTIDSAKTPPLIAFDVKESNGNAIYTLHSCTLKKRKPSCVSKVFLYGTQLSCNLFLHEYS